MLHKDTRDARLGYGGRRPSKTKTKGKQTGGDPLHTRVHTALGDTKTHLHARQPPARVQTKTVSHSYGMMGRTRYFFRSGELDFRKNFSNAAPRESIQMIPLLLGATILPHAHAVDVFEERTQNKSGKHWTVSNTNSGTATRTFFA